LAVNRHRKALPILEKILKRNPTNFHVLLNLALLYFERKKYSKSELYFIQSLAIDNQNTVAHHGLGLTLLRQNRVEEAIEEFLIAIETNFYFPKAHYHLGEALFKMENYEDATKAFEVALRIAPNMIKPHEWLWKIYSEILTNKELALRSKKFLSENKKGTVILLNGIDGLDYSSIKAVFAKHNISLIFENAIDFAIQKSFDTSLKFNFNVVFVPVQALNTLPSIYNYKFIELIISPSSIIESSKNQSLKKETIYFRQLRELERLENLRINWLQSNPLVQYFSLDFNLISSENSDEILRLKDFLNLAHF
jgi:hypothetical protein